MRFPILLAELAGIIGSIAVIVKGGIMFFRWRRRKAMRKAREQVREEVREELRREEQARQARELSGPP
jgi:hypothetical protein